MMYAWETTARYVFKNSKFLLSIPYSHKEFPNVYSFRFNPVSNCIELKGTIEKNVNPPYIDAKMRGYNPEISLNNNTTIHSLYYQRQLEAKTKSELC